MNMVELTMYKAKKYGRNEWIYGWLVMVDCRHAIMRDTLMWLDDGISFVIDVDSWDFVEENTIHIGSPFLDDDDTRIYDGDIIASGNDRYVVIYDDGAFWAKGRVGCETNRLPLIEILETSADGVKVVGNKHDDFDMYMKILLCKP